METELPVDCLKVIGEQVIAVLSLSSSHVGVRLLLDNEQPPDVAKRIAHHRYCQALMRARRGEHVVLTGDNVSCPGAAAAFGFRPLPEGLKSGKGFVGFGIVADEAVGKKMFEGMPKLKPGQINRIYLFPLSTSIQSPEIVVVEDEVEKLMWIALAYLHAKGGARIQSSTAVL